MWFTVDKKNERKIERRKSTQRKFIIFLPINMGTQSSLTSCKLARYLVMKTPIKS